MNLINTSGEKAVGLSGKDGQLVLAQKRLHKRIINGTEEEIDLGQVGDVLHVNTEILNLLLNNNYIPVITCLASDEQGNDYNINGDVFAGHIAGAMDADEFVVLTDVDGLLKDVHDSTSLISLLHTTEIAELITQGIIKGGMIPKLEACCTAIEAGSKKGKNYQWN